MQTLPITALVRLDWASSGYQRRTQLHCHELLRSLAIFAESVVKLVRSPLQAVAAVGVCPLCGIEVLLVFGRVLLPLLDLRFRNESARSYLVICAICATTHAHLCHDSIESSPFLFGILERLFPIFKVFGPSFEHRQDLCNELLVVGCRERRELRVHVTDRRDGLGCTRSFTELNQPLLYTDRLPPRCSPYDSTSPTELRVKLAFISSAPSVMMVASHSTGNLVLLLGMVIAFRGSGRSLARALCS